MHIALALGSWKQPRCAHGATWVARDCAAFDEELSELCAQIGEDGALLPGTTGRRFVRSCTHV